MAQENKHTYNLTNDYLFKKTFGYQGQEHVASVFLRDLFLEKVENVLLDNSTITEKDVMTSKMGIMDVKAVVNNSIQCDIEMQVVSQDDIVKRILFYISGEYRKSISSGQRYSALRKTVAVLIADFEIDRIAEIPKYITKWNFREESYPGVILTDALEIYIIELPKLTKYENNTNRKRMNFWAKFIKNPEVMIVMNENDDEATKETKETIQEAQEKYEQLLKDKHEMELAELRQKYILDQRSIMDTGYRKGHEAGINEATAQIVKKLVENGMGVKEIAELIGLSEKEVLNIIEK